MPAYHVFFTAHSWQVRRAGFCHLLRWSGLDRMDTPLPTWVMNADVLAETAEDAFTFLRSHIPGAYLMDVVQPSYPDKK